MFDDKQLIDLVRQNLCLWDTKSRYYKHKVVKEKAWKSIANNMNQTVEICQGRWLNLRQRYLKEKRKMKNMPSGSEGTDAGLKWILFEKMTFIDAVVKPRNTLRTINSPCAERLTPTISEASTDELREHDFHESQEKKPEITAVVPELEKLNFSFGRTVALMLEAMSTEKQARMRNKILNVLIQND